MIAGKLYLVAMPIGNIEDMSIRCVKTLTDVDFIAAEHEAVTTKQLFQLGIYKPVISCYGRGTKDSCDIILPRILKGESCALVTDAGTPAVSDPGEYIVRLCSEAGIEIISIPGPCAAIAALAASGLPTGRFTFEGYLSMSKRSRIEHLIELRSEKRTMIFYEAPQKLKATLRDMLRIWGDRRITILREMTKPDEERLVMTLAKAVQYFSKTPAKGEIVLVIEGATK